MGKSVLFITYDGLTDQLGGSQILPYLRSIAEHPRKLHILSFEKLDCFSASGAALRKELRSAGIEWTPLTFSRGGKFAKAWDLLRMYAVAARLMARHRFGVVHCRSYQAAQVGCCLKRFYGCRVLFDMRGLWADERVDGGLWKISHPVERMFYMFYKRVERKLLECADHVVALTQHVVPELRRLAPAMTADVSVIPCCADFTHFSVLSDDTKATVRTRLGIPPDAFLLSYLGSLGTWYQLEEMLDVFVAAARARADVHMLLITRDWEPRHAQLLGWKGGADYAARLHVVSATRAEVPALIGAADLMLSFIMPAYSKMASSPTKLAEAFACGVPVVCNPGIGDVDMQVEMLNAGVMIHPGSTADITHLVGRLDSLRALGGTALRDRARKRLDLPVAAAFYRHAYHLLEGA
ncbi:glycosyltransferase [Lysobacter sp. F6437]|uniref:glycosyltransferase n=1 Tax=Lysobacter sp. F6437 TaxID=3459296 RepID=UPI00403DB785